MHWLILCCSKKSVLMRWQLRKLVCGETARESGCSRAAPLRWPAACSCAPRSRSPARSTRPWWRRSSRSCSRSGGGPSAGLRQSPRRCISCGPVRIPSVTKAPNHHNTSQTILVCSHLDLIDTQSVHPGPRSGESVSFQRRWRRSGAGDPAADGRFWSENISGFKFTLRSHGSLQHRSSHK